MIMFGWFSSKKFIGKKKYDGYFRINVGNFVLSFIRNDKARKMIMNEFVKEPKIIDGNK